MQKGLDAFKALNIGTSKEVLKNSASSPMNDLLQLLLQDVSDQLRDKIDQYDISASNNLKQSINVSNVSVNGSRMDISITADFYWKYVNYGVNGTEINRGAPNWGTAPKQDLSFKQAILNWIPSRGIQLPESFASYESFAYAIMTNKRKFGQETRPFVNDVITDKLIQDMKKPIQALIGKALEIQITVGWQ